MKKWVGEKEYTLKGKVTDRATGRPLQNFSLHLKEHTSADGYSPFQREFSNPAGEYNLKLKAKANYDLEVRANGYSPEIAKLKSNEDAEARTMDFKLEKSLGLWGKVALPNGQPAARADVAVSSREYSVIIGKRALMFREQGMNTDTAEDGSFSFRPVLDANRLIVVDEKGFAEVDLFAKTPPLQITLQPWGRIEGKMSVGGEPAANQEVGILEAYWDPYHRGVSFNPGPWTTSTDGQGNFVLEDVPPMEVRVCRMVNRTYRYPMYVSVKPGEATRIRHAPEGYRITGRLIVPDADTMDWKNRHRLDLSLKMPELPSPKGVDSEEHRRWARAYWRSPEGKAYQRAARHYGLEVSTNSHFHIDDVPPGSYELNIELREKPAQSHGFGRVIGRLKKAVAIPEPSGVFGSLDIGSFEVEMVKVLNVGDRAPDFKVKTLDGEPLQLSDYRGKYVLLDFWATWCGPCIGEIPNLKQVHSKFGKDERFALIGLSLDKNTRAPRDYARTNMMNWTQGYLGDWSDTTIPKAYGVEAIPATFLIGPDGRIRATNLRGLEALNVVAKELGKE